MSCPVPYHFYSKIHKKVGTHDKSPDTGHIQLKLYKITVETSDTVTFEQIKWRICLRYALEIMRK